MLRVKQGDITKVTGFQAIINPANNSLLGGGGIDGSVHRAAGPQLKSECRKLNGCETGDSRLTLAYNLPCNYIIHSVGPVWSGGMAGEEELLTSCYLSALKIAVDNGIRKLAMASISTGDFGYPVEEASKVAVSAVLSFLKDYPDSFDDLCWIVSDANSYKAYSEEIKAMVPKPTKASKKKAKEVAEAEEEDTTTQEGTTQEKIQAKTTTQGEIQVEAGTPDSTAREEIQEVAEMQDSSAREEVNEETTMQEGNAQEEANKETTTQEGTVQEEVKVEAEGAAAEAESVSVAAEVQSTVDSATSNDDVGSENETVEKAVETSVDSTETVQAVEGDDNAAADVAQSTETMQNSNSAADGICPSNGRIWDKYTIDWLIEDIEKGIPHRYLCFEETAKESENAALLLTDTSTDFYINGRRYISVLQYVASEKALLFEDTLSYKCIKAESDQDKIKGLFANITIDEKQWQDALSEILFKGYLGKALRDEAFRNALVGSGSAVIIYAGSTDENLGVDLSKTDLLTPEGTLKVAPTQWHRKDSETQEKNLLGFALMAVRDYLK